MPSRVGPNCDHVDEGTRLSEAMIELEGVFVDDADFIESGAKKPCSSDRAPVIVSWA